MRRFLPLLFFVATGCGGNRDTATIDPLTAYGDVEIAAATDFNGSKDTAQFSLPSVPLESGILSLDALYDTTPVDADGSSVPARRVEIALVGFDLSVGKNYGLSGSGNVLRLHQKAVDGSDLVWVSTGGSVLDGGVDHGRRLLKLQSVLVAPVVGTGATGTATLSGSFHIDLATADGTTLNP